MTCLTVAEWELVPHRPTLEVGALPALGRVSKCGNGEVRLQWHSGLFQIVVSPREAKLWSRDNCKFRKRDCARDLNFVLDYCVGSGTILEGLKQGLRQVEGPHTHIISTGPERFQSIESGYAPVSEA